VPDADNRTVNDDLQPIGRFKRDYCGWDGALREGDARAGYFAGLVLRVKIIITSFFYFDPSLHLFMGTTEVSGNDVRPILEIIVV